MAKEISDKEIMAQLLEALNMKAYPFSIKLEKVHRSTIYNILQGVHGISYELVEKIIDKFPNVNPDFLKKGKHPVLINDRLQPTAHPDDQHVFDVLSIPQRLMNLEESQKRIEDKLNQLITLATNK